MTLAQSGASAFAALLYEVFAQTGSYFSILNGLLIRLPLALPHQWLRICQEQQNHEWDVSTGQVWKCRITSVLTRLPKIHPQVRDVCYVYIFQLSMKLQTYFCSEMEHILVNGLATCVVWWGKQILNFFWFLKEWKYNYITNVGKPQNQRIRNISTLMI